jgi:hypothetical protein
MGKRRRLVDEYRFPGYRPNAEIRGVFGDPRARIVRLERAQKKRFVVVVVRFTGAITTRKYEGFEICRAEMLGFIWRWGYGGSFAGSVGP